MSVISRFCSSRHHQGMTLVETLITVAVVAILVGVTVPSLGIVYDRYRIKQEQRMQLEIYDALLRFAEDYNAFPTAGTSNPMCGTGVQNWYDCLTTELDYSAEQIRYDVWGNERRYVAMVEDKTLLGETYKVHYASLHSRGPDLRANGDTAIPASGANFAPVGNGAWWANLAGSSALNAFEALESTGDDVFVKVTDSVQKARKLKETQERLAAISQAIYDFEQVQYVIDLQDSSVPEGDKDTKMHFPPAMQQTAPDAISSRYGKATRNAVLNKFSLGSQVENRQGVVTYRQNRLQDMITLMRLIGLPDHYCCSALDIQPDAVSPVDYTQQNPFFYYANPRELINGTCAATRATQIPFTPPVVTRNQRENSAGVVCD